MKSLHSIFRNISLGAAVALTLAVAVRLPAAPPAKSVPDATTVQLRHITTQAQAEALKPGDSMSMTCSKCKDVMIQKVTTDQSHVKMMTIGETMKCPVCEGTVEVVAAGKGKGKDATVKHVCSKCGDDAMFCSATYAGTDAMSSMKGMTK